MRSKLTSLTFTALITAILCVLSPFSIPLPEPMPAITLATFVLYFSGCVLGPKYSCMSLLLYLLLGCVGVPVFSKGQAGLQVLFGPTGGYLLGYFFIALCTGLATARSRTGKQAVILPVLGMIIGTFLCYTFGTLWLAHFYELPIGAAIAAGVTPFLIGDLLKIVAAAAIAPPIQKQLRNISRP
ncbi:MAG: biotin transporter BioY [Lachnospiraceae bacterium]|nr:biotin transporter BioY [Lachnospiraceae bacterium]